MLPSFTNNKLGMRTTCSGPLAIEDRASLDKMANACIFPSCLLSHSVKDLRDQSIKVCFNFVNIVFSFSENFNKSYYTVLKKCHQERAMDFRIFCTDEERGQFFGIIEDRKRG